MPGQALRVPGGCQVEGVNVVSTTHRPPLPPGNIPGIHFYYRLSQPQGHRATGRIMSVTPSGIEPANFRLVAECPQNVAAGPVKNLQYLKNRQRSAVE